MKVKDKMIGNQYALGYHHTNDAKRRIGESHLGNHYALGYHHTNEHKEKMGKAISFGRTGVRQSLDVVMKKVEFDQKTIETDFDLSKYEYIRTGYSPNATLRWQKRNHCKKCGKLISVDPGLCLSCAIMGHIVTKETRDKLRIARLNQPNIMFDTSIKIKTEDELQKLNINYIKQFRTMGCICDFYLPDLNLIVECDGDYWHNLPDIVKRDFEKDRKLVMKYNILRLSESYINSDNFNLKKMVEVK